MEIKELLESTNIDDIILAFMCDEKKVMEILYNHPYKNPKYWTHVIKLKKFGKISNAKFYLVINGNLYFISPGSHIALSSMDNMYSYTHFDLYYNDNSIKELRR